MAWQFRRLALGCAFAVALVLAAAFASSAGAVVPVTKSDLALGDSLAFGYSQQLFNENEKLGEPPTAFNHGYANDYFNQSKAKLAGFQLINNGCPGETTDSMIGNGPLGAALEAGAGAHGEAPCAYHYAAGLPLHHEYGGTKSQLENALETIAVEEAIGKPVTTLTLNIGANDQLRQVKACEKEVGEEWAKEGKSKYGGETPTQSFENCLVAHVTPLFTHILTNIGASLYAIRNGAEFGGVNYLGKIVVQLGYDPYGAVFEVGKELLNNSNNLVAALNSEEGALVEKFGACAANPQPKFNPRNKREPEVLQKWTNMANFTEFEGKKNGPDIHPTPSGYAQLATIMKKTCGIVE
jgi:lysophospholipase L1-like esterase